MKNETTSDYLRSLTTISTHPTQPNTQFVDQWREANRSLRDRLSDLLKTIPPEVQRAGLHLRDLQARLKGRKGKMCDHAELGAALRSLGFRRTRQWDRPDQGFLAVWKLDD